MISLILVFWFGAKGEPWVKAFYDDQKACEEWSRHGGRATVAAMTVGSVALCYNNPQSCTIEQAAKPMRCVFIKPKKVEVEEPGYYTLEAK